MNSLRFFRMKKQTKYTSPARVRGIFLHIFMPNNMDDLACRICGTPSLEVTCGSEDCAQLDAAKALYAHLNDAQLKQEREQVDTEIACAQQILDGLDFEISRRYGEKVATELQASLTGYDPSDHEHIPSD